MPTETEDAIQSDSDTHGALFRDTILQTLNRRVGVKRLILPAELFAKTAGEWDGVPIIKQEFGVHPSATSRTRVNPAAVAAEIGGDYVGTVRNPRIETTGHPRLVASLETTDADVVKWWNNGELGVSTAFNARDNGDVIVTPPIPNHVLLFREVPDHVLPGDDGAIVMTELKDGEMQKEKISFTQRLRSIAKSILSEIEDEGEAPAVVNTETVTPEPMVETPEPEAQKNETETMEEKKQENPPETPAEKPVEIEKPAEQVVPAEPSVVENDAAAEIAELRAELAKKDAKLAEIAAAEVEQKFTNLLNSLPEGARATGAQREELRQKFATDPLGFATYVVHTITDAHGGETRPAGSAYAFTDNPQNKQSVGDASKW